MYRMFYQFPKVFKYRGRSISNTVIYFNYGHGHGDNAFSKIDVLGKTLSAFIRQDFWDLLMKRYKCVMLNSVKVKLRNLVMENQYYVTEYPIEFESDECPKVPECNPAIASVAVVPHEFSMAGTALLRDGYYDMRGYHFLILKDYEGLSTAPVISQKVIETADNVRAEKGLTYKMNLYAKSRSPTLMSSTASDSTITVSNSLKALIQKGNSVSPLITFGLYIGHDNLLAVAAASSTACLTVVSMRFSIDITADFTFSKLQVDANYEKEEELVIGKKKPVVVDKRNVIKKKGKT